MDEIDPTTIAYVSMALFVLSLFLPNGLLKNIFFFQYVLPIALSKLFNSTDKKEDQQSFSENSSEFETISETILSGETTAMSEEEDPQLNPIFQNDLESSIKNENIFSEGYNLNVYIFAIFPILLCIHIACFVSLMRSPALTSNNTSRKSIFTLRLFAYVNAILFISAYQDANKAYQALIISWCGISSCVCAFRNLELFQDGSEFLLDIWISFCVIILVAFFFILVFCYYFLEAYKLEILKVILIIIILLIYVLISNECMVELMNIPKIFTKSAKRRERIELKISYFVVWISILGIAIQSCTILPMMYDDSSIICYIIPLFMYSYPLALLLKGQKASSYMRYDLLATLQNLAAVMLSLHMFQALS
jgi:hypothetical protein